MSGKSMSMKKWFVVALAAFSMISFVAAPSLAKADEGEIMPQLATEQVVDTYYHYACPNGITSHNMDYNKTYKVLSFKTSYKRTGRETLGTWKAKNCSCGNGTVYHYKNIWYTW